MGSGDNTSAVAGVPVVCAVLAPLGYCFYVVIGVKVAVFLIAGGAYSLVCTGSCAAAAGSLVEVFPASTFVPVIAVFGRPFSCFACVVGGVNIAVFLIAGGAYSLACAGGCTTTAGSLVEIFPASTFVPVIAVFSCPFSYWAVVGGVNIAVFLIAGGAYSLVCTGSSASAMHCAVESSAAESALIPV